MTPLRACGITWSRKTPNACFMRQSVGFYAVRAGSLFNFMRSLLWWIIWIGRGASLAFAAISVLSLVCFSRCNGPCFYRKFQNFAVEDDKNPGWNVPLACSCAGTSIVFARRGTNVVNTVPGPGRSTLESVSPGKVPLTECFP